MVSTRRTPEPQERCEPATAAATAAAAPPPGEHNRHRQPPPQQQPQQPQAGSRKLPAYAAAQEQKDRDSRARIAEYRRSWQQAPLRGPAGPVVRHIADALWWLLHICGASMLDFEERVVVLLVFAAAAALIALGAYRQGAQLAGALRQLVAAQLAAAAGCGGAGGGGGGGAGGADGGSMR